MESGQNNMKTKFYSVRDNLESNLNSAVLPTVKYEELIWKMKIIKSGEEKCSNDYKLLQHYNVLEIEGNSQKSA